MVQLTLAHRLAFVAVTLRVNEKTLTLPKVLLDTGSGGTIFKTVDMETLGLQLEGRDVIRQIFGVGEGEYVIEKQVSEIIVGDVRVSPFNIQMGAVNYGIPMDGILGLDFLLQAEASIDFKKLILGKADG